MVRAFFQVVRRDLSLALRQGSDSLMVLGFFVVAVVLFPLGIGPEPQLLALDEPAAGMNATETAQLRELISTIRHDGVTVLLIEHDVKLVMGLCDRVAVLNFGKKIAEDVPAVVQKNQEVIEAYLGSSHHAH